MTPLHGYIAAGAMLVLVATAGISYRYGYKYSSAAADVAMAAHLAADRKAEADHREALRTAEQNLATAQEAVSEAYEKGKRDAESIGEGVVADLRAGNLRLQKRWSSCEANRVPSSPTAPSEPDAAGRDREESAGRIIRAAAQCDTQVRELQALINTWRGLLNKQ